MIDADKIIKIVRKDNISRDDNNETANNNSNNKKD